YIHIPFCVQKCAYCDFLSAPATEEVRSRYVEALLREIEQEAVFYRDYPVETVFFGGGTPTVLKVSQLEKILCKLKENFLWDAKEISLECNPGTVTPEDLKRLHRAGFNRISIGLQSAQEEELKKLGRIHTYETFLDVFRAAREAGFDNINVDLMSALPGQTLETYLDTLEKVQSLSPEHISAYSLIIEKGTPFYETYHQADLQRDRDGVDRMGLLPSEDEERAMYEATKRILAGHGYERYEISNYAKAEKECRHNLVYWKRGNYLGLGLGASSMVDETRWKQTEHLEEYLNKYGEATPILQPEKCRLTKKEQMEEFMMLGLRMMSGVSPEEFEKNFSVSVFQMYGEVLEHYQKLGLLEVSDQRIRFTDAGIDVSNVILADFL
ncbi:MAG: radical SAM family heme chaperone HemW, partial [Lachnospiraceae bacterium]